ncbi:hypothetical protein [Frankia tisae]|uniref:hypothetical protein n=1 Tax=Frankia tisae TaxID=2950104 RepID=UPI0021BEC4E1|nr:hypothetical protein [Frankia tisae]
MLIVDNANWFLPSRSRSPNSRRAAEGAAGQVWTAVLKAIQDWRSIWTSNGVWDTTIFFTPVR